MKKQLILSTLFFISLILNVFSQIDKTIFVFGNSLIRHETIPVTDEVTVPHWLHFLALEAGHSVAVSGQYGFLPQHDNLPPQSQWGFTEVQSAWESDIETFSTANFNTILLTPGNFIQYQPSNIFYDFAPGTTPSDSSPLTSTLTILDWLENEAPSATTYIYENWPDMGEFSSNSPFSPTSLEFENYNNYTQENFHDWWLEYQDFIEAARPSERVKMIPVGPTISKLLTNAPLNQISILDLYEDNAPHGRPTLYFLASLITYMAIYEEKAPSTYVIPDSINLLVSDNYQSIIDFIWDELLAFNYSNGSSRVFKNNILSTNSYATNSNWSIFPNPSSSIINVSGLNNLTNITLHDINGRKISIQNNISGNGIDISNLSSGVYVLAFKTENNNVVTKRIIKI